MKLLDELREKKMGMPRQGTKIMYKVFEDTHRNQSDCNRPGIRPRTKHINIKYWHFVEYVKQGRVNIQSVKSEGQSTDILPKPLPTASFEKLRDIILDGKVSPSTPRLQVSVINSGSQGNPRYTSTRTVSKGNLRYTASGTLLKRSAALEKENDRYSASQGK